ncbi:hypothetical protein [Mammaliicoccus sp. D-M17]|uniref:hypothetical protein n=1 Tax=Mammaliicoccus sp. D-M17 TaxID=2898677 RepID=UPI001EFB0245|nr:hypothetical protein [Mammaliicoccus sp. D-M17]
MPTIKRKVEMNLPQLIEWGWKNKELSKNKRFTSKNKGNLTIKQSVIFNHFSYAEIECNYCYGPEDIFTVEIEEEITENTVMPKMLTIYCDDSTLIQENTSLKFLSKTNLRSAHIMNNDGTLTLIWAKEKGLVE